MKKFIKTFLLTTFLGTFALPFTQAQNTITVGDGISTYNYAPVYTIYNYGFSRMLYLSSDLQTLSNGGRITHIAFYISTAQSGRTLTNQAVYMRGTSINSESTGYIDPTAPANGCTQVWTGSLSVSTTGWATIALNTPFILSAGQNLEIFWNNLHGSYFSTVSWQSTTVSGYNAVSRGYSDASFASAQTSGLATATSRPNLRITYLPLSRTASVAEIVSPASTIITWAANTQASVKIANLGKDTITSCRVNWKVNGVTKTSINYTQPLIGDSTPVTINLGTFAPDSNVANNLTVWIDNALPYDSIQLDDTLSFDFYACTYFLNGTYTIGGAGSDFATISAAINHLMGCGVSGPTTFLINNGTYNESVNMVGAIPGTSAINTVTFTSVAGHADSVQIAGSGTTWLLSNISNVYFRNLTIGSQASMGQKAVELEGNCSNIEFYQCNLYAYTSAASSN
jgi:hypothetical protein